MALDTISVPTVALEVDEAADASVAVDGANCAVRRDEGLCFGFIEAKSWIKELMFSVELRERHADKVYHGPVSK